MNDRRAPIIAGVAFVLIAILAVFFLVLPKRSQVSETQDQLDQAVQQQSTLEATLRSLQEAQAEAPQTRKELKAIEQQIPPLADLPGMIRLLSGAADQAAVDFLTVSPGTPTLDAGGAFSAITTSVSVTGTYFSLEEFLYRLETLPRAAKVTNVSVSPGGGTTGGTGTTTGPQTLSMQLTVNFYTTDTSAGPGSEPGPSTGTSGA
ncbi:MAG: type 4a pilus biogenesis protein PilO [Candidatus Velamenicoccus archaeovorus]